jgi:YQGE family putative transporter
MSQEEKQLIILNGVFFFTVSIAGIFVNLFLFQLGGFQSVVTYGLVNITSLLIIYFLSGYLLKKYSSKALIRSGLLLFMISYTALFLLGEKAVTFLIPLGIIQGLANGCYWPGNNLTQYIATHNQSRNEYFGKLFFYMNIGSAFGPILGGLIIYFFGLYSLKFVGYGFVFFLVALLFAVLLWITNNFPAHKGSQFSFQGILKHKRLFKWRIVLIQQFLYGLFDVSFAAISTVLIFLFLKEEFSVGAVNTVSTLVFAGANFLAIRLLKRYKWIYVLGMFFSTLGLFLFGISRTWLGIFGLIFLSNSFMPLLNITASKGFYDTIDSVKEDWKSKYHFLVEREIALDGGRILIYAVLLFLFTPDNQVNVAKTWILVIPLLPLLIGLLQIIKER